MILSNSFYSPRYLQSTFHFVLSECSGSLFPSCCETDGSYTISPVFCYDYRSLNLEAFQKQTPLVKEKDSERILHLVLVHFVVLF